MTDPSNTSVTAQFGAGEREEKTKLAYVKRWRTVVRLPEQYADEIVEALRAAPVSHTSVKDGGVDPADLWEEWLAETDEEYRTPQSALAFAVDRLTAPTGSDAVADGARDIVKRLLAFYVGNPGPKTQVHYPPICKEAADTITLLRSGNQHMCEEIERLRSAPVADGARAELASELMAFHDCCTQNAGGGDGEFRVECSSGSDAQARALRAILREAAAVLRSAPVKDGGSEALREARIAELEAALMAAPRPKPTIDPVDYMDWFFQKRGAALTPDRKAQTVAELISIEPEILQLLGKTVEEVADMLPGEFAELAHSKGMTLNVSVRAGGGITVFVGDRPPATDDIAKRGT